MKPLKVVTPPADTNTMTSHTTPTDTLQAARDRLEQVRQERNNLLLTLVPAVVDKAIRDACCMTGPQYLATLNKAA